VWYFVQGGSRGIDAHCAHPFGRHPSSCPIDVGATAASGSTHTSLCGVSVGFDRDRGEAGTQGRLMAGSGRVGGAGTHSSRVRRPTTGAAGLPFGSCRLAVVVKRGGGYGQAGVVPCVDGQEGVERGTILCAAWGCAGAGRRQPACHAQPERRQHSFDARLMPREDSSACARGGEGRASMSGPLVPPLQFFPPLSPSLVTLPAPPCVSTSHQPGLDHASSCAKLAQVWRKAPPLPTATPRDRVPHPELPLSHSSLPSDDTPVSTLGASRVNLVITSLQRWRAAALVSLPSCIYLGCSAAREWGLGPCAPCHSRGTRAPLSRLAFTSACTRTPCSP
jgi:hypothetical protein